VIWRTLGSFGDRFDADVLLWEPAAAEDAVKLTRTTQNIGLRPTRSPSAVLVACRHATVHARKDGRPARFERVRDMAHSPLMAAAAVCSYGALISGLESKKSAVARLHAIATL
jgi:hypothetical protein